MTESQLREVIDRNMLGYDSIVWPVDKNARNHLGSYTITNLLVALCLANRPGDAYDAPL